MFSVYGLLFFSAFHLTNGFLFGNGVYPDWDELSVTAMVFDKLPKTENEAKNAGWSMDKDACSDASFFYGRRYILKSDVTTMLLYDVSGRVAGIQMALPKSEIAPTQNWIGKAAMLDNNTYALTAYFTEPKTICSGKRATKQGYVGDKLFLSVGKDKFMEIPLKESDVDGDVWGNGRCFVGMGQHYWYQTSKDMSCDDFFPFFLLYNGGNLNAFGFASSGNVQSHRVEHPSKSSFGWFFKVPPQCFYSQGVLSTQHVYLQRRPYLNLC